MRDGRQPALTCAVGESYSFLQPSADGCTYKTFEDVLQPFCNDFALNLMNQSAKGTSMPTGRAPDSVPPETANALRGWTMVVLTTSFVLLYAAALFGWLKPLSDERVVARLEPIVFVIIGYYFGRRPSQQNEAALKSEVTRQTQRADAAQHAKEQAQQSREALEEKVKNARAVLTTGGVERAVRGFAEHAHGAGEHADGRAQGYSVAAALSVLNS